MLVTHLKGAYNIRCYRQRSPSSARHPSPATSRIGEAVIPCGLPLPTLDLLHFHKIAAHMVGMLPLPWHLWGGTTSLVLTRLPNQSCSQTAATQAGTSCVIAPENPKHVWSVLLPCARISSRTQLGQVKALVETTWNYLPAQ